MRSSTLPPARDHRIDVLRGFALATIFINHIPGNVVEPLTSKNFGLSDSAELFVLLAGISAAFAYYGRFSAGERLVASARAVKRAGTLYVAHLASTLVGLAIIGIGALEFGAADLLDGINIPPILEDPVRGLVGIALLTHQLGYHNILPMYVCLLLAVPAIMLLARAGLGVLLAASLAVYLLAQVFLLSPPNWPGEGGWFFNPVTWQLLFVAGFIAGIRMRQGRTPVPYHPLLWWSALAYLAVALVWHRWNLYGSLPEIPLVPHQMQVNEKPWLALPRLAHVLALAYVVGHSRLIRWIGRAGGANPLAILGRQALPVFWLGTALSMVGQVVMASADPGPVAQVLLIAAGLAVQVAVALGLDRLGEAERGRRASQATRGEAAAGARGGGIGARPA